MGALLLNLSCAGELTARDHDAPYAQTRAGDGCGAGDEACCQRLEASIRPARERFDDKTADEAIERIALSCPVQVRGVLDRRGEHIRKLDRKESAGLRVSYQLALAPEDTLFWAAAYVDGAERTETVMRGDHQIDIELHVVSGLAPHRGKLFRLQQTKPLPLGKGGVGGVVVKLARAEGAAPFALDVKVLEDASDGDFGGVGKGVAGVLTKAEAAAIPRYGRPARTNAPAFYAPAELLLAAASRVWLQNCVAPDGSIDNSSMGLRGSRQPHPRLMGAALDWLRRFQYATPGWDPSVRMVCEEFEVHFDRSPAPPPAPGGATVASFGPRK
jgi:hypothetical protein